MTEANDVSSTKSADFLPRRAEFGRAESRYELWRIVFLRATGLQYCVAYVILLQQHAALFGSHGLLPAAGFLDRVAQALGSNAAGFWKLPSLFWLDSSDAALSAGALCGVLLSVGVMLGWANAPVLFALWALYLSFVHVGQVFYGYGWESLLCEMGFLAVFLAEPLSGFRRTERAARAPELVVVLLRWLTFRVMFGAGLIKLRGDACWTQLTCLDFHYETQPNPGPLSATFHQLPQVMHRAGVLFNHFVELIVPFGVFGPRFVRRVAGVCIIVFQLALIASGNLSFLNWLTILIALSCFDDGDMSRLFGLAARQAAAARQATPLSARRRGVLVALAIVIGLLGIEPALNLLSPRQAMNAAFDPFQLVNTYGAFGSVSRERLEVELEGTAAATPDAQAVWRAYEFPCKPGDPQRRPCFITPYHYHLDWQMWFLQFNDMRAPLWLWRLVAKLLSGDAEVLSQFSGNPFADRPPRFVRARVYQYRFSRGDEPGHWQRQLVGDMIPAVTLDDLRIRRVQTLDVSRR